MAHSCPCSDLDRRETVEGETLFKVVNYRFILTLTATKARSKNACCTQLTSASLGSNGPYPREP